MICQLRVDDRLIHGQVAMAWTRELNIEGIVVISDAVVNDKFKSMTLDLAKPMGTKLVILGLDKGIEFLNSEKIQKFRVLVIVENPSDALKIVKNVSEIRSVNIGGLRKSEGKRMISQSVAVNDQDVKNIKELIDMGIEVEIRQVPSDSKILVQKLINL